jgi:phosphoribosylformylglycinamidine cyclo-ligase
LDEDFGGMPIGRALLEPTRLYVKPVLSLMEKIRINGMAHVTGGGFHENIPRMFASPHTALVKDGGWTIPPIFARIAYGMAEQGGGAPMGLRGAAAQAEGARLMETDAALRTKLFNTFNMGIGFVLALSPADADAAIAHLDECGCPAWKIGRVVPYDAATATTHGGKAPGAGDVRFEK